MRKIFLVSIVAATLLTTGITTLAAEVICTSCVNHDINTVCTSQGEHLWNATTTHTATYTLNGVLHQEQCTISKSEDKTYWICPAGHGIVSTTIRHRELHSCSHCSDMDYSYEVN